jgi:hypothetical protein
MSKSQPKAKFYTRTNENGYLNLTIWPGKSDPSAEVIVANISQKNGEKWETVTRIAVYRTSDGNYSKLPERQK